MRLAHRVLVTGGAGVIGRVLVRRLAPDAEVLSVDRASQSEAPPGVETVIADLSDQIPDRVRQFDPDTVFHLAATFERTQETPEFWERNFVHNVLLPHRLLQVLRGCPSVRVVLFASTYLVYDSHLYLERRGEHALRETDPISPRNLVGLAKFYTERELEFLATAHGWRVVSARIFRVFGCGSKDVVSRWVRLALDGAELEVYGREGQFDYVYADDVAEGLLRLARAETAAGVVNLGSGTARSIAEVLETIERSVGRLQLREVPAPGPLESSRADLGRLREWTSWRPTTSLEAGITQIAQYERRRRTTR